MLTERGAGSPVRGRPGGRAVAVIPCCADLDRLDARRARDASAARAELGLAGPAGDDLRRQVHRLYMEREMVEFFAVARASDPGLVFLVLTQAPPASIEPELQRAGIRAGATTGSRARSPPSWARLPRARRLRDLLLPPELRPDLLLADQDRRVPRGRPAGGLGAGHRRRGRAAPGPRGRRDRRCVQRGRVPAARRRPLSARSPPIRRARALPRGGARDLLARGGRDLRATTRSTADLAAGGSR